MAPRLANGILAAVFCAVGLSAFFSVLAAGSSTGYIALSVVYLLAVLGLQLGYFSRPTTRFRPAVTYPAIAVQALLVYVPVLQFGEAWVGLPGFLAGSLLLSLRPAVSIPGAAVVVASMGVLGAVFGKTALATAHLVISATITGLVVYGLTRLVRLVSGLHAARGELARMAVAEERLRISRDVHDLLGLSLSAITLKSELADRLITDHPERARAEITEILETSRRALADARQVASGSRTLSLHDECRSARSILYAADVEVRIAGAGRELPDQVSSVLATVLREGITNVLRHSKAEHCQIEIAEEDGAVVLEIVNDGAVPPADEPVDGGHGIDNLSHRVRALGGSLTADWEPGDTYRLRAVVPL
ncbi:histidine kinase [Saccharopolyspora indica]|uniref:sensor histidine kinase n=1 Tax=Saccharopolyspora indica TaxID=1229659 RepID=UPI0022EA5187|nr:histidine kinase [Saccharopolyspora indica]MDA3646981.1 histidine kinase [Saccharopolyspora indica]